MIRTDFDAFIAKFIDTYFFDDLETIRTIKKMKGNVAYLYIFAVCSEMEFLGALLREKSSLKQGKVDTSNALSHYVKNYLIPVIDEQYKEGYKLFQKVAPALIRNGIAHSYAPKGPIAVGRYDHLYKHVTFQQINGVKQLFINADALYLDFKKSYIDMVKPLIQPNGRLHERAQRHYEEIRTFYRKEAEGLLDS
ncbi:MAG: hypothetical protein WCJ36_01510 [Candidatus Saccharibacteria bacterium]